MPATAATPNPTAAAQQTALRAAFAYVMEQPLHVIPKGMERLVKQLSEAGLHDEAEQIRAATGLLPSIQTNAREPVDVTREALAALYAANEKDPRLFLRGTDICRVREDNKGLPAIGPVGPVELSHSLMRAARFHKMSASPRGGFAEIPCYPPEALLRDILGAPTWEFPPLEAICETPVLRPDGSLLITPGYDRATGLYYHPEPGLVVPAVPDRPTPANVKDALALIDDMIGEFPFAEKASYANTLALLLTPVVRAMIGGCVPLGLISKRAAGTGGSLLVRVSCMVVAGATRRAINHTDNDQEMRKAITTVLQTGPSVVLLDNVRGVLDSPSLDRVLTEPTWEDRRLGSSDSSAALRLPNRALWLATANNASLRGDLARRTFAINLDAKTFRPWERRGSGGFKHPDLPGWVSRHRGVLLGAVLTLARAWAADGAQLANGGRLGGFDEWERALDGILASAGVEGFLENQENLYQEADEESAQWADFLDTLMPVLPYAKSALAIAQMIFPPDSSLPYDDSNAAGAITKTAARLQERLPPQLAEKAHLKLAAFATEIGKVFSARKSTRYDEHGLRLEPEWSGKRKSNLWKVVRD
jgi:hypothetical protein